MRRVSLRLVTSVGLTVLVVLAGCTGATGSGDGTAATTGPTTPAGVTTTEAPAEPPFEITNDTELLLALGETNSRLRGANFTYERVRLTGRPGTDLRRSNNETMWVGRNGSVRWITRSGPYVFDTYRPGSGLQYERAYDTQTGETEYSVHNHTDDLFVEELRLGPMQSVSPVPYYWPNTSGSAYRGIGRFEGERLHVYRIENSSERITLNVTLYVTDGGFIRHAEGRAEIERQEGTTVRVVRETYRDVNETTVEPPDWLDEARAAEG